MSKVRRIIALVVVSLVSAGAAVAVTVASLGGQMDDQPDYEHQSIDSCYRAAYQGQALNTAWQSWKHARTNYVRPGAGTDEERQLLDSAAEDVNTEQTKFYRLAQQCADEHPEAGNGKA